MEIRELWKQVVRSAARYLFFRGGRSPDVLARGILRISYLPGEVCSPAADSGNGNVRP